MINRIFNFTQLNIKVQFHFLMMSGSFFKIMYLLIFNSIFYNADTEPITSI